MMSYFQSFASTPSKSACSPSASRTPHHPCPIAPPRVAIIGVPISALNLEEALTYLLDGLKSGVACGHYICVSNVHTTVMAHDDPAYHAIQSNSYLSLPDGKPLSLVGRKTYTKMGRVSGPDLMREVFSRPEFSHYTHYFYGNTAENLAILQNHLLSRYPHLQIGGFEPSTFAPLTTTDEKNLAHRIEMSGAHFVWVGTGAPRQEILCAHLQGKTQAVMVGVGGAFNVIAGIVPEAPLWMQRASLEWLYRLAQEPRRLFKRYLKTNTRFIYLHCRKGRARHGQD